MQPQLGLVPGTLSASLINNRLTCRFQRLINVIDTNSDTNSKRRSAAQQASSDVVFSLDASNYYILMAKGKAVGGVFTIIAVPCSSVVLRRGRC